VRASRLAALIGALIAASAPSWADDGLQNWFNDPFFQITSAMPDCPLPAGPFTDERDRQVQSHRRAEKGTTCWLAKECDRPNAYAYDQDIASSFQEAVRARRPFPETSLWVTVQGRVVYIEGCAASEAIVPEVEAFARSVPHVQQATAIIRGRESARTPYRVRPSK
jgi:hypothetical protein